MERGSGTPGRGAWTVSVNYSTAFSDKTIVAITRLLTHTYLSPDSRRQFSTVTSVPIGV